MDIVERMLSNDKTMESIAKLKDALSSVDMSEQINTVIEHVNTDGGRHLQLQDISLFIQRLIAAITIFYGLTAVILFAFSILFADLDQFCDALEEFQNQLNAIVIGSQFTEGIIALDIVTAIGVRVCPDLSSSQGRMLIAKDKVAVTSWSRCWKRLRIC